MVNLEVPDDVRDEDGQLLVGVGDTIRWETITGEKLQGVIEEMDSNVAYVRLPGGLIPVEL